MDIRVKRARFNPSAKKRCDASSAFGWLIRPPEAKPPIFLRAPAMPPGLRVNWTAAASARNSRWRETADLISRPKSTPMYPMIIRQSPARSRPAVLPPFLRVDPPKLAPEGRADILKIHQPIRLISRRPCKTPIRRRLRRISPLRT